MRLSCWEKVEQWQLVPKFLDVIISSFPHISLTLERGKQVVPVSLLYMFSLDAYSYGKAGPLVMNLFMLLFYFSRRTCALFKHHDSFAFPASHGKVAALPFHFSFQMSISLYIPWLN